MCFLSGDVSEYSHCRYPEAKIAGTPASQDKLKVAKGLPKGKEKYDYNVQEADQVSCDGWTATTTLASDWSRRRP